MRSKHDPHGGPADHHTLDGHDLRRASKRSLIVALVLKVGYMFADIIGGVLSGSLALLAHAGHMLTDAASIALALVAMHFAGRAASVERTFGYHRLEILAALLNALTLWLIAAWVMYRAFHRLDETHHIHGELMLGVGAFGLVVNIAAAWILRRSVEHSVNVEGAYRHVVADLLGAVGVVVSGFLVSAFGWTLTDTVVSVLIGVLILISTWRLLAKVVHVLLEGSPDHIDVYSLCSKMEELEGVTLLHDIHVWTIVPGYDALTAHILVDPEYPDGELESLGRHLREIAARDFGIQHITLQVERSPEGCTEHHHVDHLYARTTDEAQAVIS